jgi:hypothetical protein
MIVIIDRMERSGTTPDERDETRIQSTALMNLARLKGFLVERKQVATTRTIAPLSDEELEGYLEMLEPEDALRIAPEVEAIKARRRDRAARAEARNARRLARARASATPALLDNDDPLSSRAL